MPNLLGVIFKGIRTSKDDVDNRRCDSQLRLPSGIKEGLKVVGQILHRHEAKKTGSSFESVERTEDRIDRSGISGVVLKNQQALLDILQELDRLTVEFIEQLSIVLEI